jgi:hypothetical protein
MEPGKAITFCLPASSDTERPHASGRMAQAGRGGNHDPAFGKRPIPLTLRFVTPPQSLSKRARNMFQHRETVWRPKRPPAPPCSAMHAEPSRHDTSIRSTGRFQRRPIASPSTFVSFARCERDPDR